MSTVKHDYRQTHGYQHMGTLKDFPLLNLIETAMFHTPPDPSIVIKGVLYPFRLLSGNTISGLHYQGHLYLQQNPASSSRYGLRSRSPENARIIWVIRKHDQSDQYVGVIDNGMVWGRPGAFKTKTVKRGT